MNIVNYNVISFEFDYSGQTEERDLYLTDLIYEIVEDRDIYLFECNPADDTFIEELSTNYDFQEDCDQNRYLYTTMPIILTKEIIFSMVKDRLFYLGHFAIVLSNLSDNKNILKLIASWNDERVLCGIEMIRMDYDGLYLFFYNMCNDIKLRKLLDN